MTAKDIVARERIAALEARIDRNEATLSHKFDGFPQEYATKVEGDSLRTTLETIRSDHVQRRELDEIRDRITEGAALMSTRREAEALAEATTVRINELTKQIAELRDRVGANQAAYIGKQHGIGISANVLVVSLTLLLSAIGVIAAIVIATHS